MARVPFILCEDFFTCSEGDCFTISNHESRHLVTVLRAREGYNFIAYGDDMVFFSETIDTEVAFLSNLKK